MIRLEAAFHRAPIGLAVLGRDRRIIFINKHLADIHGVEPGAALGRLPSELLEDLGEAIEKGVGQVLEEGGAVEVEFVRCLSANPGLGKGFVARYRPVPGVDGSVSAVIAVVEDVSDAKWQEALLAVEYGVAKILSQSDDLGQVLPACMELCSGPLGVEVWEYWSVEKNRAVLEERGLPAKKPELDKVRIAENLVPAESFGPGEGLVGGAWTAESPVILGDPTELDGSVDTEVAARLGIRSAVAFPIGYDDSVVGVIALYSSRPLEDVAALPKTLESIGGTFSDFLRRMRAEERVRANEHRLQQILERAQIPIMQHYLDPPHEVFAVNETFTRVTGFTADDFSDGYDWMRKLWHLEGGEADGQLRRLKEFASGEHPDETLTVEVFTRDGARRYWTLFSTPVLENLDRRPYMATKAVDMTVRRELEENLDAARKAAENANRAKSEFLAKVSHEIRTPLSASLGYAELLMGSLTGIQRRQVEGIKRSSEHVLEIVRDIMDISRIEAGHLELEREVLDPAAIVMEAISMMEGLADDKGLELEARADGLVPRAVKADPVRLRQILLNLLSNAVKFTQKGKVTVSISFQDAGEESSIRFAVRDTGIGIAPEALERLFRPFVQANDSISGRFGGTGLGLDITRRLTELMGGTVQVESEEGSGSTFTVELPTGPVGHLTSQPFLVRAEAPVEGLTTLDARILVVEDSVEVRGILRQYLEEAGAQVLEAPNGFHGIDVEKRDREAGHLLDAVLLDLEMPLMDGYETLQALRGRGFDGAIVAVTASDSRKDISRSLEAGFAAVIPKPIDRGLLLRSIRDALSSERDEEFH